MPFNRNHVRGFLAKTEIDLFESSLGADVKALTAADVQRRIARTRKLRDKYRDLLKRQKLATRARTASKAGHSGEANERTAKKAKAFEEVLARFEAQAKNLNAADKKSAVRSRGTAKAGAGATKKAAATKKIAATKEVASTKKVATSKKAATSLKRAAVKRPAKPKLVPVAVTLREGLQKKRAAQASAADAQSTRSRKAPASAAAVSHGVVATPPNVRATVVASRLDQAGMQRIQGHTGTQVRREQAKRDHRG